ncbi:helix-turn-helix domain-containing protein [Chryseobacterium foetidum]|uniref:helix-turn-helix domain-containing protein n=1 Tax=Chryseobacterium foetidum TaxID=2951057 RepID=UPI0021C755AE|nr:helix-turn-helix transcriptional regulator [Chryseobacterium foetidum]
MMTDKIKKDFLTLFGERIKELRTIKNLSYRKFAQNCDIDYSDISKIEKGKKDIQLTTMLQLATGLDLSIKELFDFEFDLASYRIDDI